jgi:hypothetical protein
MWPLLEKHQVVDLELPSINDYVGPKERGEKPKGHV